MAYPDLRGTLSGVLATLDAHPLTVTTAAGTVRVDGALLSRLLFDLQKRPGRIPNLIYRMSQGDFTAAVKVIQNEATANPGWAWATQFSIMCADGVPRHPEPTSPVDAAALPTEFDRALNQATDAVAELCEQWPVPHRSIADARPVVSTIPTLLLAGRFDQQTAPYFADIAAGTLRRGQIVQFPDRGHGTIGDGCSRTIADAFIVQPASPPPTDCVAGLTIQFTLPS